MSNEAVDLLRRLDGWQEGEAAGPLIRWAAACIRGSAQPEDNALAERRATVERIRVEVARQRVVYLTDFLAILDAEAD